MVCLMDGENTLGLSRWGMVYHAMQREAKKCLFPIGKERCSRRLKRFLASLFLHVYHDRTAGNEKICMNVLGSIPWCLRILARICPRCALEIRLENFEMLGTLAWKWCMERVHGNFLAPPAPKRARTTDTYLVTIASCRA